MQTYFLFFFSYEPEINPGATVRLSGNAVLKVFTTGNLTVIGRRINRFFELNWFMLDFFFLAPSIERINTAVYEFYPQLFECRKWNHDQGQCWADNNNPVCFFLSFFLFMFSSFFFFSGQSSRFLYHHFFSCLFRTVNNLYMKKTEQTPKNFLLLLRLLSLVVSTVISSFAHLSKPSHISSLCPICCCCFFSFAVDCYWISFFMSLYFCRFICKTVRVCAYLYVCMCR